MGLPSRKELEIKKQEINNLYGKLSEVEATLKEEKKINARLRSDLKAKMGQLGTVETSIVEEQERFVWNKNTVRNETFVIQTEGANSMKELDKHKNSLDILLAEHDLMEDENTKWHSRLKSLATEHYQQTLQQTAEREMRKQKSFEMRATMEQILRKTLKEVDKEYMLRANDKMGQEAKWAREENIRLRKEAGKRQEDCARLVDAQKFSYDSLVQTRVEKGVLESTTEKQEESSEVARQHNNTLDFENLQLEDEVTLMEEQMLDLQRRLEAKKELHKVLDGLQLQYRQAKQRRQDVQRAVVRTGRKSVRTALGIIDQENVRNSQKLTRGFEAMSGDAGADEGKVATPEEEEAAAALMMGMDEHKGEEEEGGGEDEAKAALSGGQEDSTTFMTDDKPDLSHIWNAKKSDVHVATRLRKEIRKMRRRQAKEAAANASDKDNGAAQGQILG